MNFQQMLYEDGLNMTRRQLFGRTALGLGTAAMSQLFGPEVLGAEFKGKPEFNGGLHHKAKAKRVIYLFMSGGPSHHDMWDYKPKLCDMFGISRRLLYHIVKELRHS